MFKPVSQMVSLILFPSVSVILTLKSTPEGGKASLFRRDISEGNRLTDCALQSVIERIVCKAEQHAALSHPSIAHKQKLEEMVVTLLEKTNSQQKKHQRHKG